MSSRESTTPETAPTAARRELWEPMVLRYAGNARELVQTGGGKVISNITGDPGDPHKPPGQQG
jgi:hypothetical protein